MTNIVGVAGIEREDLKKVDNIEESYRLASGCFEKETFRIFTDYHKLYVIYYEHAKPLDLFSIDLKRLAEHGNEIRHSKKYKKNIYV